MTLPVRLRPIPLWDHWSSPRLQAKYEENPRSFERGFFLRAYSDDEATFPSFAEKARANGLVLADLQRRDNWPAFMGVDLSSKKRPGNAITAVRVNPMTRERYPIDVAFLAKGGPEVCEAIQVMEDKYHPVAIGVEDNGYQDTIMDWIGDQKSRFRFWIKVEATTTFSGRKNNAQAGLPGLEVEFKNGAWHFPYDEYREVIPGDKENIQRGWWARLDKEFRFHPIAAETDGVMSIWFARQMIEQFGGFSIPEQVNDLQGDFNQR